MTLHHSTRSPVGSRFALTIAAALTAAGALGASTSAFADSTSGGGAINSTTDCVSVLAQPGRASGLALQTCEAQTGETAPYAVGTFFSGPDENGAYPTAPGYGYGMNHG